MEGGEKVATSQMSYAGLERVAGLERGTEEAFATCSP